MGREVRQRPLGPEPTGTHSKRLQIQAITQAHNPVAPPVAPTRPEPFPNIPLRLS